MDGFWLGLALGLVAGAGIGAIVMGIVCAASHEKTGDTW